MSTQWRRAIGEIAGGSVGLNWQLLAAVGNYHHSRAGRRRSRGQPFGRRGMSGSLFGVCREIRQQAVQSVRRTKGKCRTHNLIVCGGGGSRLSTKKRVGGRSERCANVQPGRWLAGNGMLSRWLTVSERLVSRDGSEGAYSARGWVFGSDAHVESKVMNAT